MTTPYRRLAVAVIAWTLVQPVCAVVRDHQPVGSAPIAVGNALPNVMMTGINGSSRSINSYAGRRLIINLWASWCGPCRAEAASLERFAWSEQGMQYTVIGISTDDDRKAAQRWLRQSNATLSHFIDRDLVLEHLLGATSIPLTVLVDEQGGVVARIRGARVWDSNESFKLIEREFGSSKVTPMPISKVVPAVR